MNQRLADAAIAAVTDPDYETEPHYCERFAREVIEHVYGDRFDDVYQASARLTAFAWQRAGYAVGIESIEVGDVLFKTQGAGPDGHVGIYVGPPHGVAENSSTSIGRVQGAKGYRTLPQWGHVDVAVRLPGLDEVMKLMLEGRVMAVMPVVNGVSLCPVRAFGQALGMDVGWDDATQLVSLDGQVVRDRVVMRGGHAYLPVRELASFAGLALSPGPGSGAVSLARSARAA